MFGTPVLKYRPQREYDGEGTVESLGTSELLWVDMMYHGDQTIVQFRAEEDVNIGDFLVIQEG